MASYKVLSDNFALGQQGDTVDSDALDGCNIPALVDGGHIAEIISRKKDSVSE
jgi:hypothetical protein